MNKKDLFIAIDNIDEKFINDAGKYLKNVNPFGTRNRRSWNRKKSRFRR